MIVTPFWALSSLALGAVEWTPRPGAAPELPGKIINLEDGRRGLPGETVFSMRDGEKRRTQRERSSGRSSKEKIL